ncbi:hypothetical protein pb186bvf_006411 [Paramecium bursaria]
MMRIYQLRFEQLSFQCYLEQASFILNKFLWIIITINCQSQYYPNLSNIELPLHLLYIIIIISIILRNIKSSQLIIVARK